MSVILLKRKQVKIAKKQQILLTTKQVISRSQSPIYHLVVVFHIFIHTHHRIYIKPFIHIHTLQRHSRATFSKAIPVSPISARSCVEEELLLLPLGANAADVARADSRIAA